MITGTSNAVSGGTDVAVGSERLGGATDVRATSMAEVVVLARDLAAARTADDAVHAAVDFCASGLQVPAAVWLGDERGQPRRLIGIWGAGRDGIAVLTEAVPTLPAEGFSPDDHPPQREAFRRAFGLERVWIIPAGAATIFVGDPRPGYWEVLDAMGSLLGETLVNLGRRELATRNEEQLELGLAVTAHELRSPLLGARAALDQLLHDDAELTPEIGLLRRTAYELDALSRKVDGLLRWSVGADHPEREPCDLVRVVREAIGACTLERGEDRIVLSAPATVEMFAAPAHMRMAVENLLRNAMVYSPRGSKVEVSVEREGCAVMIAVRDEGVGVPPEEREKIFDAFARGSSGRYRAGHGLGLFITKRVVDAHGGELLYESLEPGRGSVFRMRFPSQPES